MFESIFTAAESGTGVTAGSVVSSILITAALEIIIRIIYSTFPALI